MNAHTLRKWSPIKIFMYLLLAICSLLVFWCQGASAMHLTPLDFSSFNLEHRRRHQHPEPSTTSSPQQNHFLSLIRNSSLSNEKLTSLHYQPPAASPADHYHPSEELKLQQLWQTRMRQKRARIQAHRKQKLLLQQLLDQRASNVRQHESVVENLKLSANPNLNINNLKHHLINHNIITQHNHHNSNKLNYKINTTASHDDQVNHHRREELYEQLNEIMANISVASNRNRRESRFHHQQQLQMPLSSSSLHSNSNSNSVNANRNSNANSNPNRPRRRRYCSARDARTLAFEAPTVFEGKIKSMTPLNEWQANFSVTVEKLKVYKQQANFTLPNNLRLNFAKKNASECDIYREEFRHRGIVRDDLEQGKIYFLFVKQISLGNFTILGQPIKKISRTVKDVELGVSARYGKRASIESMSANLTVKEGKRARIVCKVDGEPAPKVTWFKDGRSINRNRTKYIFVHLRRRSDLIIKSAAWNDSGKYECRAKNKLTPKRPVSKYTWLDVLSKSNNPTTPRTQKPNEGMKECPAGGQLFCLNGGKCWFIESLQEPSCDCPEGFSGKNCEDKTPNITANFELADPYVLNHALNPPVASTADYDDDD